MKTSELLIMAKQLIATPATWTQTVLARTKTGASTCPDWPEAVSFCSLGALELTATRQAPQKHNALFWDTLNATYYLEQAAGDFIEAFNDAHTHAEVMAVWDAAIKIAQSQGD